MCPATSFLLLHPRMTRHLLTLTCLQMVKSVTVCRLLALYEYSSLYELCQPCTQRQLECMCAAYERSNPVDNFFVDPTSSSCNTVCLLRLALPTCAC